jgi:transcriptional regulator with XRE-family HTH domain
MDISINQRLKKIIKDKKINAPELYKKLGVDRTTWSGWINSNKAISVDKLVLILIQLKDIDARWLITGERQVVSSSEEIPEMVEEQSAKYKTDCCRRCKDLENQIELYKKLLSVYENPPKKETGAANSVQFRQAANE